MQKQEANLQSLRKEYLALKEILGFDLTNWDPRTRSGMEGKKNSAKVRIETVKNALANAILSNSNVTIISREYPHTGQVVGAAKSDPQRNALVDYLALEKAMYKSIFGDKDGKSVFNTETLNRMNVFMAEVGERLGAISMPTLTATGSQYGALPGRQEMIEKFEEVAHNAYGYELKQLSLRALIFDRVIDRIDQDSVNIVIVNVPDGFVGVAQSFAGQSLVLGADSGEVQLEAPKASKTRKVRAVKAAVDEQQS